MPRYFAIAIAIAQGTMVAERPYAPAPSAIALGSSVGRACDVAYNHEALGARESGLTLSPDTGSP